MITTEIFCFVNVPIKKKKGLITIEDTLYISPLTAKSLMNPMSFYKDKCRSNHNSIKLSKVEKSHSALFFASTT